MYFEVILPVQYNYLPVNQTVMETFEIIPLVSLLVFSAIFVVSSVLIYDFLKKRGEKVSFLFLRFFMITYAQKYRHITKNETQQTGSLFWLWLGSINLALLSFILYLIFIF